MALALLVLAVPLGATASEVSVVLAVAALFALRASGKALEPGPLAGAGAMLIAGWWVQSLGPGGTAAGFATKVWALAPLFVAPALLRHARPLPWMDILALSAIPAAALFFAHDHHLTWAYTAVLISLALWGTGRRVPAAVVAISVAATTSVGAVLALATAAAAAAVGARRGLAAALATAAAGMVATLTALAVLPLEGELYDRAMLWTGGAELAGSGGVAPGVWRSAVDLEHMALDSSFHFPHHAHDSLLQLAAEAGPGAWVAVGWAGWVLWTRAPIWAIAAAVALGVGGLTQDVLGDLEVLRAACVLAALALGGAAQAQAGRTGPWMDTRNSLRPEVSTSSE